MSHELRTPMNGVLGVADLLRLTDLSEEQKGYTDLVERSATSLLRIIDDILDFARLEAGKITLQDLPFDLEEVLRDVVDLLQPGAEEKGLGMTLEIPPNARRTFIGDPTRIRQVLMNLVGNAVKFTEHGQIEIRYESGPLPDARLPDARLPDARWSVRIAVADSGVGIPQDQLDRIFEKFERAETRLDHHYGGTGLGLAIARHLTRMMEGDLTVESEPGVGSTFVASLVLAAHDRSFAHELVEQQVPDDLEGLRALVVEDDEANRQVICSMLDRLGISYQTANNGEAAIDRWNDRQRQERSLDLIVMDVRMPVLDGLEATRRIRAAEAGDQHIPIIALTANASKGAAMACFEAGMDLFLAKPIRFAELVDAIRSLLERGLIRRAGDPSLSPPSGEGRTGR